MPPLGIGANLQIAVPATAPILDQLCDARWSLFMDREEKWYRAGAGDLSVRQFVVEDPDGYIVSPAESLGTRVSRT